MVNPGIMTLLNPSKKLLNYDLGEPLTQVYDHGDKDDQSKPSVEHCREVNAGNDDVNKRGEDVEDEVLEEAVDGAGTAIHDSKDFPGLPGQVPTEGQVVEMLEQGNLYKKRC